MQLEESSDKGCSQTRRLGITLILSLGHETGVVGVKIKPACILCLGCFPCGEITQSADESVSGGRLQGARARSLVPNGEGVHSADLGRCLDA